MEHAYVNHPWIDHATPGELELFHEHYYRFYQWAPDWEIQTLEFKEKYKDCPRQMDRVGIMVRHSRTNEQGEKVNCIGAVNFDNEINRASGNTIWTLVSMDPLHLEPSIQCGGCPDHGFIRAGKWVPA